MLSWPRATLFDCISRVFFFASKKFTEAVDEQFQHTLRSQLHSNTVFSPKDVLPLLSCPRTSLFDRILRVFYFASRKLQEALGSSWRAAAACPLDVRFRSITFFRFWGHISNGRKNRIEKFAFWWNAIYWPMYVTVPNHPKMLSWVFINQSW